jgi:hypothetical protein
VKAQNEAPRDKPRGNKDRNTQERRSKLRGIYIPRKRDKVLPRGILPLALLAIGALVFLLYWIPPLLAHQAQTPCFAYFNELAKSFLHRHLSLPDPACHLDLTYHDGKWYVPFPPLGALLMMPWVAIFGDINTALFAACMGAADVALAFLMLWACAVRKWISLSWKDLLWLTALFALGTVHWYMSTQGSVWFVAQISAVTFVTLSVFLAVRYNSPWTAGLALGLAMLGRPNLILTYPLLLAIGIQHGMVEEARISRGYVVRWILLSAIPIAAAASGLLVYNALRFGNPLDFGYAAANVDARLAVDLRRYGQFSLEYLGRNLKVLLFSLPVWDASTHRLLPDEAGLSLLLTTPAFVYIFRARRKSPVILGAWISFGLLLIPLVTYFNTGWSQFGYRFSLDFTVPLLVLIAFGSGSKVSRLLKLLIAASILINFWGTAWFLHLS